ncbi:hypothetical protein [Chromobacterium violaceum]|uniref:hypothetical protein n=1 Tax=Chromobacterium violaceum TaxID=536 RepID=UPI000B294A69|nr:hypothetical protein [Chromobacterium violaceum]
MKNKFIRNGRGCLTIAIAITSLFVSIASWRESKKANEYNEEQLRVVLSPANDLLSQAGIPSCGYTMTIPLTWRIFIFNNSAQPVTIENAQYSGFSNHGMIVLINEQNDNCITSQKFPTTIAARSYLSFSAIVPINAPKDYAIWYQKSGLCNNRSSDFKQAASKAGFTITGGTKEHPSFGGLSVWIKTSDGHQLNTQAEWDNSEKELGPNIILPPQEN